MPARASRCVVRFMTVASHFASELQNCNLGPKAKGLRRIIAEIFSARDIIFAFSGGIAQLVERLVRKDFFAVLRLVRPVLDSNGQVRTPKEFRLH
jgi:hypothetical protein